MPPGDAIQAELLAVEALLAEASGEEAEQRLVLVSARLDPRLTPGAWGEYLRLRGDTHAAPRPDDRRVSRPRAERERLRPARRALPGRAEPPRARPPGRAGRRSLHGRAALEGRARGVRSARRATGPRGGASQRPASPGADDGRVPRVARRCRRCDRPAAGGRGGAAGPARAETAAALPKRRTPMPRASSSGRPATTSAFSPPRAATRTPAGPSRGRRFAAPHTAAAS